MQNKTYKKILAIALATMSVAVLAGCTKVADYTGDKAESGTTVEIDDADEIAIDDTTITDDGAIEAEDDEIIGMPSPIIDYDALKEAEDAVGFEITLPEALDGYSESVISTISDDTIQVIYSNDDGREITIRKAEGTADISGDYNVYTEECAATVNGDVVTISGNDGKYNVATWTANDFTYSIYTSDMLSSQYPSEGISMDEMIEIVRSVD